MNKFITLIPKKRTGSSKLFSYSVPENLQPEVALGQLVKAPFRNRTIQGLIVNIFDKAPDFPTKPIEKIVSKDPILPNHLMRLIPIMETLYLADFGQILTSMIPATATSKVRKPETGLPKSTLAKTKMSLTGDQSKIVDLVSGASGKFLIHGVTGAGKTEVYIELARRNLAAGKGVIILVPEIALTPQTINRFSGQLSADIGVWHSGLSPRQKSIIWKKLRSGEIRIVIGSRSAIFAPIEDLGLIVIDECHEPSYKQDSSPRYQAVKLAEEIAEITGCSLVLGSATPQIEQYNSAVNGYYRLLELRERIGARLIPQAKVIDMRERPIEEQIFSAELIESLGQVTESGRQAILFINRRGSSTIVLCQKCGWTAKCPVCDIAYTHHSYMRSLICHHCGRKTSAPDRCPDCGSDEINYLGTGTQKVEQELKHILPRAKILRIDRDSIKSHQDIWDNFAAFTKGYYNVMIGTQMIAKGLDLPNVDLVGVISADTALFLPDFRAAERTYQLIQQVAGRTGRGDRPGRVLVQTYNPDHPAIIQAVRGNYAEFFNSEIEERDTFAYPPFSRLARLVFAHSDYHKAQMEAEKLTEQLKALIRIQKVWILGPSQCFLARLRGKYRWQILIKSKDEAALQKLLRAVPANWTIDIDPVSML